jgi:DNA-binding NtrC family response regulator
MCVLIVDDEQTVLRTTARMVRASGLEVLEALGPEQARDLWAEHRDDIDIVLSDVVMPGIDGIALTRTMREERPELQVVLMSGYPTSALADHDLDPNLRILAKPFSREVLMRTLTGSGARARSPGRGGDR